MFAQHFLDGEANPAHALVNSLIARRFDLDIQLCGYAEIRLQPKQQQVSPV